jgi:ATP-dependent Clp protease ATP-binding subunit ClpA/ActR/RegA family two-component response regulator
MDPERRSHPTDLVGLLSRKIIGQADALQFITPYIQMYQAGLSSPGRPAGIFLLLGPTGTGKTRTVEALAEILHGSARQMLKIDCAEYQSDHEVAKLIGAPPGYLGHRETKPMLSQERLNEVVTDRCDLALVLFDEIEKAAPAFTTLLLGLLDKAVVRLGDNNMVNFERTLIFLTSNLGARDMLREVNPDIGFQPAERKSPADVASRLESIGLAAVRKRFSPEFVNRLDAVITYRPLDAGALAHILDAHVAELQRHVHSRLGERSFEIDVTKPARDLLLERGASAEYGARELKRTIHRMLTQPLAALVAGGEVEPGARVVADRSSDGSTLVLQVGATTAARRSSPLVLILDDNEQLLDLLERGLDHAGVTTALARTAEEARQVAEGAAIDLALVDLMLPDGDGISIAFELLRRWPHVRIVLMTGAELSADEVAVCERQDFPVLRKPFLVRDAVSLIKASVLRSNAAGS